ncbi:hypothetical protein NUW58_g3385 [Xylaria curta]|uniref:Uncharacterized protein n=1 Tax=Xylaria curta TaxID=42375 RepID=A0ACC1PCF8_9PEZI|nr:hypothetical protein NUW58_g3385 [Xylaria curta]
MATTTILTGRLPAALGTVALASIGIGMYSRYLTSVAHADGGAPPKAFGGGPAFLSLKLQSTEVVNHNTKRLRFALPTDEHVSGLALTSALLTFSWPKGCILPCVRPYTPITKNDEAGVLELMVKKYPNGKQSTHLHSLQPGDSLRFVTPIPGYKWTPNKHSDITLIAGGAGITPMYQLIQGVLCNPEDKTRITLVFGVNTDADVLLKPEFEEFERRFPGRFKAIYTVSNPTPDSPYPKGYVTKELLSLCVRATSNGERTCWRPETAWYFGITRNDELLEGQDALDELARRFNNTGLEAYGSAIDTEHDYSKWAITFDTSIEVGNELHGFGSPIEIKSPPMTVDNSRYENKFHSMWSIIDPSKIESIEYWKMASTHIYFEEAIDDILPGMADATDTKRPGGWKYCDRYMKRNRVRPEHNNRQPLNDLRNCWWAISSARDMEELHYLLCYDDDRYRRDMRAEMKNWKWNFKGLDYKTIEFRQMSPSRSAQDTLDWITFTTEFVQAAAKVDRDKLSEALDGKITFTEALGFGLGRTRELQEEVEQQWAMGEYSSGLTWRELQAFLSCSLGCNSAFWARMHRMRQGIEAELAQLPRN